jgi:hypothetical protein
MNDLIMCQLEASRELEGSLALERVVFVNDVKWPRKCAQCLTPDVTIALNELKVANAKIMIRNTYQSLGGPAVIDNETNKKMWKKCVRKDSVGNMKNLDYTTMESQLLQAMKETSLIPSNSNLSRRPSSIYSPGANSETSPRASVAGSQASPRGSISGSIFSKSPSRQGSFFESPSPRKSIFAAFSATSSPATSPPAAGGGSPSPHSPTPKPVVAAQQPQQTQPLASPLKSLFNAVDNDAETPVSSKNEEMPTPEKSSNVVETKETEKFTTLEVHRQLPDIPEEVKTPDSQDVEEEKEKEEETPKENEEEETVENNTEESEMDAWQDHGDNVSDRDIDMTVSEDRGSLVHSPDLVPEVEEEETRYMTLSNPRIGIADEGDPEEGEDIDFVSEGGESVEGEMILEPDVPITPVSTIRLPILHITEARLAIHEMFVNHSSSVDRFFDAEHERMLKVEPFEDIVIEEQSLPILEEIVFKQEEEEATEAEEVKNEEIEEEKEPVRQIENDLVRHEAEDKFDSGKELNPAFRQSSSDTISSSEAGYHANYATSYDSRYDHIELKELGLLYDSSQQYIPSEVVQAVNELVSVVESNTEPKKMAGIALREENLSVSPEKENNNHHAKSSPPAATTSETIEHKFSSLDTTDRADSELKESEDSYEQPEAAEEEEEEEENKDDGQDHWGIDIYGASDAEVHHQQQMNESGFGYEDVHRYNSDFDDLPPPPISLIYVPSKDEGDSKVYNVEYDELSELEEDPDNHDHDHHDHDGDGNNESGMEEHESCVSSVGFDRDSSVAFSETNSQSESVQCAQVMESSSLPKCFNLGNTQRTDNNLDFEKYLSKDLFDQVRILILRENFLTDVNGLNLRNVFPKLKEMDVAKNYLGQEILPKCLPSRLRKLDLSKNQISNIKGLISCKKLEELNLSYNRIRFLEPLPASLISLDISCNWIDSATTFRCLSKNHKLSLLDISGNAIALVKNTDWNIKTLVPGLLKCTIICDRMLQKRKLSPRLPTRNSLGNTSHYSKSSVSSNDASPEKSKKNQQTQQQQHQLDIPVRSPIVAAPQHPGGNTATISSMIQHQQQMQNSPNRLETAVRSLRGTDTQNSQTQTNKLEYLKKAKEFSGKVRDKSQLAKTKPGATSTTIGGISESKDSADTAILSPKSKLKKTSGSFAYVPPANTSYIPVTSNNLKIHSPSGNHHHSKSSTSDKHGYISETSSHYSFGTARTGHTGRTNSTANTGATGIGSAQFNTLKRTFSSSTNADTVRNSFPFGSNQHHASTGAHHHHPHGGGSSSASKASTQSHGKLFNGPKVVSQWIVKNQNKINRCVNILSMIIELAKTELLLSATTHYGLLQEWTKIGFFDLNPMVCSFTVLVKPDFLSVENIVENDEDYKDCPLSDILFAEKLWNELTEFHELFIQIYVALEISILHQINFRILFDAIMKSEIGRSVNQRLNNVYDHDEIFQFTNESSAVPDEEVKKVKGNKNIFMNESIADARNIMDDFVSQPRDADDLYRSY